MNPEQLIQKWFMNYKEVYNREPYQPLTELCRKINLSCKHYSIALPIESFASTQTAKIHGMSMPRITVRLLPA